MLTSLLALDGHRLDELDAVALASVVPPLTETWERLVTERIGVTPASSTRRRSRASSTCGSTARRGRRRPPRQRAGRPHRVRRAGDRHRPRHEHELRPRRRRWRLHRWRDRAGARLSLEALVGRASKLPRIELRRPPSAIGANTVHAMQSGTVLGYIGLVSGLLTALRGELLDARPQAAA